MSSTTEEPAGAGERAYAALLDHVRETETLGSTVSLLHWDQETMMPPGGGPLRAEQLAAMSDLLHRRRTDPRIAEWLDAAEADERVRADTRTAANLREIRRAYDRQSRLPLALVREMAQTASLAMEAWKEARAKSDFAAFAQWLEKLVRLNRAKAECLGAGAAGALYDMLLDEYEPGTTATEVERVFGQLRSALLPMLVEIAEAPRRPNGAAHARRVPIEVQEAFNRRVAGRLGYDFAAGRLDTSTHPFCQEIGFGDVRITTRYTEDRFPDSLSSTMHETGHALYEQGLPKRERWGQPLAEATSFAIHESQSRLWENQVGRSLPFWEWALAEFRQSAAAHADGLSPAELFGAVNLVEPSLIRVDADEATYNLHIMLRFDLERALLTGDLPVSDLPGAWNERFRADLGVEVPDDRRGCLQDVHWSMGAIGYFPTYTLGTLYAAQFWEALRAELGDVDDQLRSGEFGSILEWLRTRIHAHGKQYRAPELCERITGKPLSHEPLLTYLREKLSPLYGLSAT